MRGYSIILNSFQPQKNSFALKTGTLALLQLKLAEWRFLQPIGRLYWHERVFNLSKLILTTNELICLGFIDLREYAIILNSFQPQNIYASKTGAPALAVFTT